MLLAILLICHLLGDFFLQSSDMAEKKNYNKKVMKMHSGIYFVVFLIVGFIFVTPIFAIISSLIIAVTHCVIDSLRAKFDKKLKNRVRLFQSFLVDQFFHIAIIIGTYYLFDLQNKTNSLYMTCVSFLYFNKIVLYTLLFATLLTPTAVFMKKLFSYLFKNYKEDKDENGNIGNIIGQMERIIIAILLISNQFGVIGFVLTAKSIARFKQLEQKDFAEKYLVGTLISVVISLVATIIIQKLI